MNSRCRPELGHSIKVPVSRF